MLGAKVTAAEQGLGKREVHESESKLEQKPSNIHVLCEEFGSREKVSTEHCLGAFTQQSRPRGIQLQQVTAHRPAFQTRQVSLYPKDLQDRHQSLSPQLGRSHFDRDPKHLMNG